MRNMSFNLTTKQIRNRTKTVTRRTGWIFYCGSLKKEFVEDKTYKFSTEDAELIMLSLRVASRASKRPDMAKRYDELANMIEQQLKKEGKNEQD